ncbi:hypothetical protein G7Y89_g5419 [Cudoniella acicularis]|uniref:Uncharacterized protein n=1 Tax=Cudoniella acicularis TaxID=354080 RepID=A0A8H4RPS3_9HELO|nr:hypothetical protein G7Y89_g5419 [Cudoniella acicularis]
MRGGSYYLGNDALRAGVPLPALKNNNGRKEGRNLPSHSPNLPHIQNHIHPSSEPTSTLRSRVPKETASQAHAAEKAELFATATGISPRSTTISTSTKETLLTHHRTEQDNLTSSLLSMASALKESSQAFSQNLENEKDILDSAGKGMDKNELGLEAATRKMDTVAKVFPQFDGILPNLACISHSNCGEVEMQSTIAVLFRDKWK